MAGQIEVLRRSVLLRNDEAAVQARGLLKQHGVRMLNLLGGAGCRKTALLEQVLVRVRGQRRIGVLEGDLATTRDAARIAALDVLVVQLLTEGGCHQTATLVRCGLERLPLADLDLVIVENVGNCVCPTNFDLGEQARLAVLSAAEGDDKPAKYAHLFTTADAVVLSKMDLAPATGFDADRAAADIRVLAPRAPILHTSTRDPASFEPLIAWLLEVFGRAAIDAPPEPDRRLPACV